MDGPIPYDPQALGAQCERCFLYKERAGRPVPPELHGSDTFLIAEHPGSVETEEGRPLVGRSGQETMGALQALGLNRNSVNWGNAVACQPPGGSGALEILEHRMQAANRGLEGAERWLSPREACRPRLLKELAAASTRNVLAMGKVSVQAVTQSDASIVKIRGGPMEGYLDANGNWWAYRPTGAEGGADLKLMPLLHAAFVMRAPRWRSVFRSDIGRAHRWFRGQRNWVEPEIVIGPTPAQLRAFLAEGHPYYSFDVETDAKESLTARLRCIGVGTGNKALIVPFLSIDGHTAYYPTHLEDEIRDILREFFTNRSILKVGHNAGYYDRLVVKHHLGVTPFPVLDTIILHQSVETELPHNLGYVVSRHQDAPSWKAGHTAVNPGSDHDLYVYNGYDVVGTARIVPPLTAAVAARDQQVPVQVAHRIQSYCAGLHENGMWIDQHRRAEHDVSLRREAMGLLKSLRKVAVDSTPMLGDVPSSAFNPNSTNQVRQLLFGIWDLPPDEFTKLGDPSTADDTLRLMLLNPKLQDAQRTFIRHLRKFRLATKLRGTFVVKLRRADEVIDADDVLAFDEEEEDEDKEVRRRTGKPKKGLVLSDGRLHCDYNVHGTTTRRLSSSNVNAQNFKRWLRDMICAEEGHVLVGADMDQLELRKAVNLAKCARYLEVFARGGDPHYETCVMIFGESYRNMSEKDQKRLRDFAKRFTYAVIYGATAETVHEVLTSTENEAGELLFPDLTLRQTRNRRAAWLKAAPEFERFWESELASWHRDGYLREPVFGHRCDFLDGDDGDGTQRNKIYNFKCQAGGAAVVAQAMMNLVEGPLPFQFAGPGTGLIQNGHDALVFEVPVEKARWAADVIEEGMTVKVPGQEIPYTAKAKIGMRWTEV